MQLSSTSEFHLNSSFSKFTFRQLDVDGDGRVSYRDFDSMMNYIVDEWWHSMHSIVRVIACDFFCSHVINYGWMKIFSTVSPWSLEECQLLLRRFFSFVFIDSYSKVVGMQRTIERVFVIDEMFCLLCNLKVMQVKEKRLR